jgi:23S rRNA pseudouridine2604 synthase
MELTINKFLVKKLSISGKEALLLVQEKKVLINQVPAIQMQVVTQEDLIFFDNKVLQEPDPYFYIAYYKPRGMECTMDPLIENNLSKALPISKHYFPIGRLDKESEGLLILTNDGYLYIKIAPPGVFVEKEYIVTVDKIITGDMLRQMGDGIEIMGEKTRPAKVFKIDDHTFRIILTQGLNRQIRRMCYKLDYEVTSLKRIRIKSVELGNLKPGEFVEIKRDIFA